MRHALLLPALGLLAACTSTGDRTGAGPAAAGAGTIAHPSECLDPNRARDWTEVDSTTLLVDAGNRKYRVVLSEACFSLGASPELRFVGDSISNRVCGHVGEYVVVGRQRCDIQRVERLDDAAWLEATGAATGRRDQD